MTTSGVPWTVAPTVEKAGMGYRAKYPQHVSMAVARLRETRGELHGELTAEHQGDQLYRGSMNLSGLTSRTTAAKYLQGQTNGANVPWPGILEHFCVGVLTGHRKGPEFVIGGGPDIKRRTEVTKLLPILPAELPTIIFAPGGTGKTTLAAGIGVSIASGLPLMPGWMPLRKAGVLVLDYESDIHAWNDLFSGIAEGMGISTPQFMYQSCDRPLADLAESLSTTIADNGIGLVIVDAMMMATSSSRDGGDASETTLNLFRALGQFKGVTKLLLDHVTGADLAADRKETTRPYGSVAKMNQARSVYEMRAGESPLASDSFEVMLVHRKVNYGPKDPRRGLRITHGDGGVIGFSECQIEAPELVEKLPTAERMTRVLREGARTAVELATELDIPTSSIRTALARDQGRRFLKLRDGRIGLGMG